MTRTNPATKLSRRQLYICTVIGTNLAGMFHLIKAFTVIKELKTALNKYSVSSNS